MLADLLLPPGFAVTIALTGDAPLLNATVEVTEGGRWKGTVTATAAHLDRSGALQQVVDSVTKRGVRA